MCFAAIPGQASNGGSSRHLHSAHAFLDFNAQALEGLRVVSRRGVLKASLAGVAGLSLPALLQSRATAAEEGRAPGSRKSVILLWMAGGPSHIDTWDPKPGRPLENRGPFGTISTALPGVALCEHLPKQAAMLDKFTIIRSVDARFSNHEPNKVFQTANLAAEPRVNPESDMYPCIASAVARFRGPNHPAMPPYVAFMKSTSHIGFAGYLGKQFDPFIGDEAADLPAYDYVGKYTGRKPPGRVFQLPAGLTHERIFDRRSLLGEFDRLRCGVDRSGSMAAMDDYGRQAVELVLGGQARDAFDLSREPAEWHQRYGNHVWCQQALLARRLVEAGVSFVTIDMSYHPASGTWDTHGDNIPPSAASPAAWGRCCPCSTI